MVKRVQYEPEINQVYTSPSIFLVSYNSSIPQQFPQATIRDLHQFQKAHPNLFKDSNLWCIDRHRKRLMDWLPLHQVSDNEAVVS